MTVAVLLPKIDMFPVYELEVGRYMLRAAVTEALPDRFNVPLPVYPT